MRMSLWMPQTEEEKEREALAWSKSNERIKKSGVFDVSGMEDGLSLEICDRWNPCPVLVDVYARLGIHRYNLSMKTNFQLTRVRKYVETTDSLAAAYYITSDVMDPTGCSTETLQTCVAEQLFRHFILTCNIAKRREDPTKIVSYNKDANKLYCKLGSSLPEWPPLNPFQNRERFDVVNKSELQYKDRGWIRLYLELALTTTHRYGEPRDYDPSNLEIVEAAFERTEVVYLEPHADSVIVLYIRYKDFCEARVGKDVDRVAIIRRRFNKVTGWFSLEGQNMSSEIVMPKKDQNQSSEIVMPKKNKSPRRLLFRQRLGIHKPWLLSFPRVCSKGIQKPWSSRRLHKTWSI